ncbi:MAG TPA: prepilin peptidase [Fimbriimonadales bacterium]|nr:prepilin peptidase [Fimbriimonadales bacterium]
MFWEWTSLVGFIIGAFIGSFLNVVIYRLPRKMSLIAPSSHCPHCNHPLGVLDLVPLLSFLVFRARCRYCKAKISWRYFVVEFITAIVWGALWWKYLVAASDPIGFVAFALASSALIAVLFIDLATFTIPDSLNVFLLLVGIAYNVWLWLDGSASAFTLIGGWNVPSSIVGAFFGGLIFFVVALAGRIVFRKDAMGHGDIKLARGIGALLFFPAEFLAFGLSIALGALLGGLLLLLSPKETVEVEGEEVPEPPEPIGSLMKCGIGYVFGLDVIGFFFSKFDRWWFGVQEEAEGEESEDWVPGPTTIPFGPYLAMSAILTILFEEQMLGLVRRYWDWVMGGS